MASQSIKDTELPKYNITIRASNINTLVIGNENIVINACHSPLNAENRENDVVQNIARQRIKDIELSRYKIIIEDSNIDTLLIGNGNTLNINVPHSPLNVENCETGAVQNKNSRKLDFRNANLDQKTKQS